MSKIKIMTDSASDIDTKLAEEYGVCVLPFTVVIDGKEYVDGIDFTPDEFYEKMASPCAERSIAHHRAICLSGMLRYAPGAF